jgi:hypothetical protein
MAYRSTQNASTGYSPNMMMLGRELPMPSHLLVAAPDQELDVKKTNFVQCLREEMQKVHRIARENSMSSHLKQKKQYDRNAHRKEWRKGLKVWLYNPTKKVGRSPKLSIYWEEIPYVIVNVINDVTMEIAREGKAGSRVVHVDRLKKVVGAKLHTIEELETILPTVELGEEGVEDPTVIINSEVTILQQMGLENREEAITYTRVGRPSKPPVRWSYNDRN